VRSLGKRLNEKAKFIIDNLKRQGVVIQRYDSYTTRSIYLKFDYGVCNSLRISDHPGKKHLSYRYNVIHGSQTYSTKTRQGWDMHFFSSNNLTGVIEKILADRQEKINKYGLKHYQHFMEQNRILNEGEQGFWEKSKIV
jgi:hypothetical protein